MPLKRKPWKLESEFDYKMNKKNWTYRIWIGFLLIAGLGGCSGENGPDCLQTSGATIREEIIVPEFSRITVFEQIELILLPGTEQKVEVETGENLRNEVSATVEGDRLVLRNENGCNLLRSYGKTKFYVTVPGLQEVRSSTGFPIRSEGTLEVDDLRLISESFTNPETETTDGSFELNVKANRVRIVANGIAYFMLEGTTDILGVTIASGDSRVDARDLEAGEVIINHRGSNDILIKPVQALRGVIRGTGNVISYNRPPVAEVEVLFKGELIYID